MGSVGALSPHLHLVEAHPAGDAESDAEVVTRAQGDAVAFSLLYRRYVDSVFRYCFHRLGTRQAAEDTTSEIFLKALTGINGCRDAGAFRSWLFAIAHNSVSDAYRKRRPVESLEAAALITDPGPGPEEQAVYADETRTVRSLLSNLSPQQARIIELRLAGLTGPEIAHVLGCGLAVVKIRQVRGYGRLREMLGQREGGGDA
jgi:RNA polymerase sigma-70 factor (ECF subfamily)